MVIGVYLGYEGNINPVLTGSMRTQPLSHTPSTGGGDTRLKLAEICTQQREILNY
jgi:hypothetical protein